VAPADDTLSVKAPAAGIVERSGTCSRRKSSGEPDHAQEERGERHGFCCSSPASSSSCPRLSGYSDSETPRIMGHALTTGPNTVSLR
jgi:hypothetical protein